MSTLDDPKAPVTVGRIIKRLEDIKRENPSDDTPESNSIRQLNLFCDELIAVLKLIKDNGYFSRTRSITKYTP